MVGRICEGVNDQDRMGLKGQDAIDSICFYSTTFRVDAFFSTSGLFREAEQKVANQFLLQTAGWIPHEMRLAGDAGPLVN